MKRKENFRVKPKKLKPGANSPMDKSGIGGSHFLDDAFPYGVWGGGRKFNSMRRNQFPSLLRTDPTVQAVARDHGWDGNNDHSGNNWLFCAVCCVLSSCCDNCDGANCPPPCGGSGGESYR